MLRIDSSGGFEETVSNLVSFELNGQLIDSKGPLWIGLESGHVSVGIYSCREGRTYLL